MKRIAVLTAIAAMLSVGLTACQPENMESDSPAGTTIDVSAGLTQNTPTSEDNDTSGETQLRLVLDLGNNILIDADIVTHAESMSVHNVELSTFDVDVLRSLLFEGESWIDESLSTSESVSFYTDGTYLLSNITEDGENAFGFGLIDYDDRSLTRLFMAEPHNNDLPFMSVDEAVQSVQELLLAVDVIVEPIWVGAFDSTVIQAALDAEAEIAHDFSREQTPVTADDFPDAYMIGMRQIINGVPVTGKLITLVQGNENIPGIVSATPFIQVTVTADGISSLTLGSVFSVTTVAQDSPDLISIEEVVEAIRADYENVINTEQITLDRLELLYAMLPKSRTQPNTLESYPIWIASGATVYTCVRTGQVKQHEISFAIDAISGQILKDRFSS
jgi:hypothetical protein